MSDYPKICLLATGGTMATSDKGCGPVVEYQVESLLSSLPSIHHLCQLEGENVMAIDSVNFQPKDWARLAQSILSFYDAFDGFVIIHGTDTMPYTAAALSYMIVDLGKPVIITGAQRSMEKRGSDARRNLIDAIHFACEGMGGVYVVFDGLVMNGTRVSKIRTQSFNAFASINYPYIARIRDSWVRYSGVMDIDSRQEAKRPYLDTSLCADILRLPLIPGMNPDLLLPLFSKFQGLIIEGYGNGGVPFKEQDLLTPLLELAEHNVAIVLTTNCLYEGTYIEKYEYRERICNSKITDGRDMATEALVVKLMWALGKTRDTGEVKTILHRPIQNDITSPWPLSLKF